eukprot:CAMPEP_0196723590 /NCGR_PEP_ID=MMETSP1091-20130531/5690_1 /TAXON_ID=302021 /ORGANISM="Rhodomonas sp., Strain CCMP768" /LENGTH=72 /DNA_ID=CAMNT_0042065547 /DNA_START=54 /DNA_END=270 /DNA_ORIENTATION=-
MRRGARWAVEGVDGGAEALVRVRKRDNGLPNDGDDQGWHRDTPDNKESSDHQITLMIYLTDVRVSNGATQFR